MIWRARRPPGPEPIAEQRAMADTDWKLFQIRDVIEQQRRLGPPYYEFLRVPSLSLGVYRLKVGAKDLQSPHDEDEVYYVLEGRGRVRIEGREQPVRAGSILFVRATAEHSFFEIEEEMTLLVFFGSGGPSDA